MWKCSLDMSVTKVDNCRKAEILEPTVSLGWFGRPADDEKRQLQNPLELKNLQEVVALAFHLGRIPKAL
jgi:hypothetical protein